MKKHASHVMTVAFMYWGMGVIMCVGCMFRVMVMCIMVIMPKGIIWGKRRYGRSSYWRPQKFYC